MFKTIEDMTGYEKSCRWCYEARRPCFYHFYHKVNQQEKSKGMKLTIQKTETRTESLQSLVGRYYEPHLFWTRLLEILVKKNILDANDLAKVIHGDSAVNFEYKIEEEPLSLGSMGETVNTPPKPQN